MFRGGRQVFQMGQAMQSIWGGFSAATHAGMQLQGNIVEELD